MAGKIVIGVWLVVLALAPLPQLGYCEQHDELVGRLVFSHGSGDFQRRSRDCRLPGLGAVLTNGRQRK